MGLKEKLMMRSNSYRYYKKGYSKLKKQNKKLKKTNLKLKLDMIDLKKQMGNESKNNILKKLKEGKYEELNISIKTPNPIGHHNWGDYFYAIALKKSFEKAGFNTSIHEKGEWYDHGDEDITILLRGLTNYNVNYNNLNIMWNISHPDLVSTEEYEKYDIVFTASETYSRLIEKDLNVTVEPLLQCFDPDVFYPKENDNLKVNEILFVGNTRGIFRDIIKDISETDHTFSVFGPGWEKFIDEEYIKDDFIPNERLNQFYSSCKILLNDHWEDMKEYGFISNRLFDALACGAFIISDKMQEIDTLFEGNIITYEGPDDLNEKINYYLEHEDERKAKALKGQEIVLKYHTFDHRVDEIIEHLKNLRIYGKMSMKENINKK